MTEQERIEMERRIQRLLRSGPEAASRRELLWQLARDEQARKVLAEMLRDQHDARAAFGYEGAEAAIQNSLERLKVSLAGAGWPAPPARQAAAGRRRLGMRVVPWLSGLAAVAVMAVSLYVALTARGGRRLLEDRLTRIEQSMAAPALTVTEPELARYRFIWSQVAQGAKTWVLVSDGEGELGSVASVAPAEPGGGVLLLQCRVLDEAGRPVYVADLLMPDRAEMRFRLPKAGSVAGRPARMDVATTDGQAVVGLSLGREKAPSGGVTGQMAIGGGTREIGRFSLDERVLRVYVRTRRISGVRA